MRKPVLPVSTHESVASRATYAYRLPMDRCKFVTGDGATVS